MTNALPFILGATFVTVMLNGKTETINSDHPNYTLVKDALRNKDFDAVEGLIHIARSIENYVAGRVRVVGDQVFYGNDEVKGAVVSRILEMIADGFDATPMVNFLDNLMDNPSKRAVDELYGFLESSTLPITEDGHFLAYKKVADDYKDLYTHTIDNSVGQVITMPRNKVAEDKDITCSYGLHFCSLSYLPQYHGGSGRVMIVKINPADVVSIPSDYNNAKGRCCRYEVIGEHDSETRPAFTSKVYRGMDPVGPKATAPSKSDYDNGYDAGQAKAEAHMKAVEAYNHEAPAGVSNEYVDGYQDGYADTYEVDFGSIGFKKAEDDVKAKRPYDDELPPALLVPGADDGCKSEYLDGYADGWRATKWNSI